MAGQTTGVANNERMWDIGMRGTLNDVTANLYLPNAGTCRATLALLSTKHASMCRGVVGCAAVRAST